MTVSHLLDWIRPVVFDAIKIRIIVRVTWILRYTVLACIKLCVVKFCLSVYHLCYFIIYRDYLCIIVYLYHNSLLTFRQRNVHMLQHYHFISKTHHHSLVRHLQQLGNISNHNSSVYHCFAFAQHPQPYHHKKVSLAY